MDAKQLIGIIEGILFVAGDPVPIDTLSKALGLSKNQILDIIDKLVEEYNSSARGIMLTQVGDSLRLTTKSELYPYLESIFKPKARALLSKAALETLSIIMHKQPVTRTEIEEIRGVSSEKTLSSLLEKNLISEAGRKDTPGKPILYTVTQQCLDYFGIKNIKDVQERLNKCIV
ncbi:MAG: SMC-Scp complex subunit ScpB [Tepidanaerobacteraceae bacterium]|jgi:segregation and condensation protein B